jgi:hypothetical protein
MNSTLAIVNHNSNTLETGAVQRAEEKSTEARPRPYLYIEQLATCTPWSADAIRTMMARGTFKLGVHYFKPHGPNGRPIFSWEAIVRYIEGSDVAAPAGDSIPLADGSVIDLNEATSKAHRLLGSGS